MTEALAMNRAEARPPRIMPVVTPSGFMRMPLLVVFGYVVATFALFLFWPINWPIYYAGDWVRLIAYVSLCLAVIGWAMLRGSKGATPVTAPLPWLTVLLPAGAIVSVAVLVPSCFTYTGHGPWEVLDSLRDQGGAYRRLQVQLFATDGQRTAIAAARAIAAPLVYPVLPLGLINWRRIGLSGRISVVVTVSSSIIFSIMRGTDKEIADLLVIGASALLVSFGRSHALGTRGSDLVRRYWRPVLLAILCVYLAQGLFTERKDARLGGYVTRTAVCANDSRICSDLDNPAIAWLPLRERFGATLFILSTCSGYYGLELAMEKPFESSWGVGHSPAALSVYEVITGDPSLHKRTFTYRNGEDHWAEEYYWSTLITWIANDVGFAGAVPVLALIGWCWGLWWREAAAGMGDPAAVLFTLATTMIFYLPANNQVLASYDGYTVFAVWLAIWLWHRARMKLSVVVPAALLDDAG